MIADSVAFCRGGASGSIYDAEHFFDGYRDDPGYALACLEAAIGAGAENVTLCDTNGSSLPDQVAEATAPSSPAWGRGSRSGSTSTTTPSCGVANSLAAVREGARLVQGTVNGYGERCGNANLASILPALQLKMGFDVVCAEQLAAPRRDRPLRRRALQRDAEPRPALRRPQRLRPQGRDARRRGRRRRPHLRAHRPRGGRQPARHPALGALRARRRSAARPSRRGLELDDEAAARAVERLKEREHRGYHYEAAPASFELLLRREAGGYEPLFKLESFRVVTEKRAGGGVETEATIKVEVDGERYVRVGRGQRPGQRPRPRPARGDRRPPPAPRRHRADQLQGADPRRDPRHRRGHPGPARLLRRRAGVGDDRRLGEHHRGLLGGAGRLAGVRLPAAPSEYPDTEPIPLARPEIGAREEELVLEVLRSGRLSLGPMGSASSAPSPTGSGSRTRSPSPAAPRRCTSGCGRSAGARATRS